MPKNTTTRPLILDGTPPCYKFRSLPKKIITLLEWQHQDEIEFSLTQDGDLLLRNKKRRKTSVLKMFLMNEEQIKKQNELISLLIEKYDIDRFSELDEVEEDDGEV